MYDFEPAVRRFFDSQRCADHRLHDQALGRVLPVRDRVLPVRDRLAQGYYDQPQLTEAVVARMLGLLNAEQN